MSALTARVAIQFRIATPSLLIAILVIAGLTSDGMGGECDAKHLPGQGVRVTFLGATTLLIDDGNKKVLIDSFFTRPPWQQIFDISTKADIVDPILSKYHIDGLEAILVSHSHYDHAMDIAYVARKTGATVYGSESTKNIGRGGGVPEDRLKLYPTDGKLPFGSFTVTALTSKHGRNFLFDSGKPIKKPLTQPAAATSYREGSSFDFLIKYGAHIIYIKASASLVRLDSDKVPKADVLFLATALMVGQRQKWKERYYRGTVETLRPSILIPIHWDNIFRPFSTELKPHPLSGHGWIADRVKNDKDIEYKVLGGGQCIVLFKDKK